MRCVGASNIVPFTRKPARPDPELPEKLIEEAPAILRWMIDGCLDWQVVTDRSGHRPSLMRQTKIFAEDMLGQWIDEECDAEPGNDWKRATSAELFASWSTYAKRAGEPPQSGEGLLGKFQLGKKGFLKSQEAVVSRTYQGYPVEAE